MRLSGGSSLMKGRTEICYNNVWFGICADNYNSYNKPSTICGVLGYSYEDATGYSSSFLDLPALPLIPYEFSCSGTKQSLLDCYKYPISCYSFNSYYSYNYGGVTCTQGINFLVIILLYIFFS